MDAPQEMLDFYLAEGIEDVCFNVEESEGEHVSGLLRELPMRARASGLPAGVLAARAQERPHPLHPRDRRHAAAGLPARRRRRAQYPDRAVRHAERRLPRQCLELLARAAGPEERSTTGTSSSATSTRDSLEQMRASARHAGHDARHRRGRRAPAGSSCEYFSVCGGGAPINKLAENGSFASTTHLVLRPDADGADRSDPGRPSKPCSARCDTGRVPRGSRPASSARCPSSSRPGAAIALTSCRTY